MSDVPLYQRVVAAMKPGQPVTMLAVATELVPELLQDPDDSERLYRAVAVAMRRAEGLGLVVHAGFFGTSTLWRLAERPQVQWEPGLIEAWFLGSQDARREGS